MKDEIQEIYLSNLKWTKTHDNIGGVMGNVVFKNNMSYEKYQDLLKNGYFVLCDKDYITNLEQENERLNKSLEYYKQGRNKQLDNVNFLAKSCDDLQERIDKAINTIQYIIDYGFDYDGLNTVESLKGLIDMLVDYARQSKDILKGGENNGKKE